MTESMKAEAAEDEASKVFEGVRELWRYRELFYFLVWRDVKVRYKQTVFGIIWAIMQPFVTMIVFTIFFKKLANMPSDGIPYPIFSYSALLPWIYFSGAINNAGMSLVQNSHLLTKVYFPRVAVPASACFCGLVDFGVASVMLFGLMAWYRVCPNWEIILLPMLMVPMILLTLGVGLIFAALNVRYRDVRYALPFVTQIFLFITPVIYPCSLIPERFKPLLAMNPLTGLIEAFRNSLLPSQQIDWSVLGISVVSSMVLFFIGFVYFRKMERTFADVI
jgi:lipopolysaccharide transport system permease protein